MVRWATRLVLAALAVLAVRSLSYALAPASPLATRLEGRVGGPSFPLVAGVALALGLGLATAIVWLASVGVRERHALAGADGEAPRISPSAFLGESALFFLATSAAFATMETYLHYQAGLGFHGLRCLVGPVHRDALPLLAALSLVAAAARLAAGHVLAWIRRTVRVLRSALRGPLRRPTGLRPVFPPLALLRGPGPLIGRLGARGPPWAAARV